MTDHIAVTGNITSVPERVEIAGGVVVAKFGIACTERRPQDGVWSDGHTNYYNVSVFRRLGEHALASLTMGQRVVVIGTLKVRKWDNGTNRGIAVDLEATSIGPDLMFGTAQFRRDQQDDRDGRNPGVASAPSGAATGDSSAPSDERPMVDASGWAVPAAVAETSETQRDEVGDAAAAHAAPALVGGPAPWSETDEPTPF